MMVAPRLASGTPRLVVDLVDPGVQLSKRELDERRLPSDWTPLSKSFGGTFSRVPTKGNIGEFDFTSRNSDAPVCLHCLFDDFY
jgi:hypothetical protein